MIPETFAVPSTSFWIPFAGLEPSGGLNETVYFIVDCCEPAAAACQGAEKANEGLGTIGIGGVTMIFDAGIPVVVAGAKLKLAKVALATVQPDAPSAI